MYKYTCTYDYIPMDLTFSACQGSDELCYYGGVNKEQLNFNANRVVFGGAAASEAESTLITALPFHLARS